LTFAQAPVNFELAFCRCEYSAGRIAYVKQKPPERVAFCFMPMHKCFRGAKFAEELRG
jgi:hypothetical protein